MIKRIATSIFIMLMFVLNTVPVYAVGNGHISGQLLDGSNQNAPLANQQVTLQMAEANSARDLATTTTDAQGSFSFDHLATDKTISYAIYTRYQGAHYVSDLVTLDHNPSPQMNLTVYQATSSTENIAIVNGTILVHKPDAQKGIITISEVFDFINLNNRSYVGSLNGSHGRPNALAFSLPTGAKTITLDKGFSGYHVIQVDQGFATDAAILPGQSEFSFSFELPYTSSTLDMLYTTMYPTVSLTFLIPPAIHANSPEMTNQGVVSDKDQHLYNRLTANNLPRNKTIHLHLEGLTVNSQLNSNLIWIIIAVLVVAAIVYVTWSLRRKREPQ